MDFEGQEVIASVTIKNARTCEIVLCLEPWGDEVPFPPGASYTIRVTGPKGDQLWVELPDFGVVVYAWSGSTMTVRDGDRLVRSYQTKVPTLPKRRDE